MRLVKQWYVRVTSKTYHVVGNDADTEFHVIHVPTKEIVGIIHKVEHPRPLNRKGVGFKIVNLTSAPHKPFPTLKSAIKHTIHLDKKQPRQAHDHPMRNVGGMINQLGHAIWNGGQHPAMDDVQREKIEHVAKAHAHLVKTFNDHFG